MVGPISSVVLFLGVFSGWSGLVILHLQGVPFVARGSKKVRRRVPSEEGGDGAVPCAEPRVGVLAHRHAVLLLVSESCVAEHAGPRVGQE